MRGTCHIHDLHSAQSIWKGLLVFRRTFSQVGCENTDPKSGTTTTALKIEMNPYLLSAGVLAILVGLVHSILGEKLIFKRLRQGRLIPTNGGNILHEKHIRILWASWHALSIFGWCLAALLFFLAQAKSTAELKTFFGGAIIAATLAGSLFVFVGTKARHPGWIALLAVAVLVWLGVFSNP